MANDSEHPRGSYASGIGALIGLVGLVTHELGAPIAVIGALWAGYMAIDAAIRVRDNPWLYLVGGGIFVAVAVVCRWRGRASLGCGTLH